jgi:hypothetical protein
MIDPLGNPRASASRISVAARCADSGLEKRYSAPLAVLPERNSSRCFFIDAPVGFPLALLPFADVTAVEHLPQPIERPNGPQQDASEKGNHAAVSQTWAPTRRNRTPQRLQLVSLTHMRLSARLCPNHRQRNRIALFTKEQPQLASGPDSQE